ncbi:MAG: hypothetical protein MZV65_09420 [Chromatiales bacterium]|nr:hypothetical protein [Chromatiales bacterium]
MWKTLLSRQVQTCSASDPACKKRRGRENPDGRAPVQSGLGSIEYVAERLLKSKPGKKVALLNFIGAMFQFQGGISDEDKEKIVAELQSKKFLSIDKNDRVSYKN